ncbi:MAG: hypothetical protein AAF458_06190 [Pseudomonadota bacterium]
MMWKKEPARRRGRVDILVNTAKPNAPFLKLLDNDDEVFERPPQPVKTPVPQSVACRASPSGALETRPTRFGTGALVLVQMVAVNAHVGERIALQLELLAIG